MNKVVYISFFLITVLLSFVMVGTVSSIKNYIDTIELAEESSEGTPTNNPNLLEEEEEHAVCITQHEQELLRKKVLFFQREAKLCFTVYDVLTRPPRS